MATAVLPDDPPKGILAFNASRVGMLQSALSGLNSDLSTVPSLLRTMDAGDCWRAFKFPDGMIHRWNAADFREFIESPRPAGCQTPIHILERTVRGTDAWDVYLRLTRAEPGAEPGQIRNPGGTNQHADRLNRDNVTVNPHPGTLPISQGLPRLRNFDREAPTGNSVSYTLRQLERGVKRKGGQIIPARPDLLERVRNGELSPNAAAVDAGFRLPAITLPVEPEAAVRILVRHFQGESLDALIRGLVNWAGAPTASATEHDDR